MHAERMVNEMVQDPQPAGFIDLGTWLMASDGFGWLVMAFRRSCGATPVAAAARTRGARTPAKGGGRCISFATVQLLCISLHF